MSEKRILIASLLKPINDTRMYEKLGVSLSKLPEVQVHICGFAAPTPTGAPASVFFHPTFSFGRLTLDRVKAQRSYYRLLQKLQPDIIVSCTHELLPASVLYCRRHRCKLVYDVQENYALNIRAQDNYPALLKQAMAIGLRSMERGLSSQIAHFLVAEQNYVEELPFLRDKFTVIENKYKPAVEYILPATPVKLQHEPLRLLYTGTIGRVYGVFEAIALAAKLHQQEAKTTLTVIGYCADKTTHQQLLRELQDKPFISLVGGDRLVPHQQIIKAIEESKVGLLPYQPNESTFRCIPTKLYEYAAHALPMITQYNPLWQDFLLRYNAGVSIDYLHPDAVLLLQKIRNTQFYKPGVPAGVFWESEEIKLLELFKALLT
ncbi:glycosyltransferase [Pontibacter toksunensis]|uniref:Glycosyltransferase n=1 Tax=Pontibacter toksunensis TaxID=1332631 RepID=A0ABW6BNG2_9BACT